MKRELDKLFRYHSKYDAQFEKVDSIIKDLCDFEGGLTYCDGDGHMVINVGTSNVARLHVLDGKSIANKLSEEEHEENSI